MIAEYVYRTITGFLQQYARNLNKLVIWRVVWMQYGQREIANPILVDAVTPENSFEDEGKPEQPIGWSHRSPMKT